MSVWVCRKLADVDSAVLKYSCWQTNNMHEGKRVSYTNCGWCLDRYSAAGCPGWIGWGGMGGSVFVWNHELNASFAYIPTQMNARAHKSRGVRLMKAFQDCIA